MKNSPGGLLERNHVWTPDGIWTPPRICAIPEYESSPGFEVLELAALAGLTADPWQAFVVVNALGRKANGNWAAFEIAVDVARQNGKGGILELLELAALFLLGEQLTIHSAHQFDTSLEAYRRLRGLIEETPDLDRLVKKNGYKNSHGEEGIELKNGQRIRFRTRTKGGGRGFTCDRLILDEAMILPESAHGALLPTLSARPNPQVIYTGSAVDQLVHDDGVVFARIRERGLKGDDPSLAYFEWSADRNTPDEVEDPTDQGLWRDANPGLGIRISAEHIAGEQRSMDARTFAVERLGVGDWPPTQGSPTVIDLEAWKALTAAGEDRPLPPVSFSFDITPDRSRAAIGVAGKRADGLFQTELAEAGPGTGWVVPALAEKAAKHKYVAVFCDGAGPAASLIPELEALDITLHVVTAKEHASACGFYFDSVEQATQRHLGEEKVLSALRGAAQRPLGDAWAWSRKSSAVDISPLVAVTLALWGSSSTPPKPVYRSGGFA